MRRQKEERHLAQTKQPIKKQTTKKPSSKRPTQTSKTVSATSKKSSKTTVTKQAMNKTDHSKKHVLNELKLYNNFVTKGSYLIVEDTNINGHPAYPDFGPGPMEAVEEFLKENEDYMIDKSKEKYYMTFNPGGYLLKIK